jgi:hypothetical protein
MKTSLAILAICASLLASAATAQETGRVPRFDDYPVKEVYKGKSAKPILRTAKHREYEVYIQAVADGGTNFAGHYTVIMLNCGEACVTADFLDLRTGRIIQRTFSSSGWREHHDGFRKIEFRSDSRLIVFPGGIGGKPPIGWHFYVFDDGKLKRLHTIVTGGDFRKPLADWMK